jgi:hypothetical protein
VALYLVERELGPRIANAVEKLFEYERRGTVWHERGLIPVSDDSDSDTIVESNLSLTMDDSLRRSNDDSFSPVFDGTWNAGISTPIGKLTVLLNISTKNGQVQGTAKQGEAVVDFVDPIINGNRLTWSQRITKPMRLNLKFDVTVNGSVMTGIAKAGVLPASKLMGERIKQI